MLFFLLQLSSFLYKICPCAKNTTNLNIISVCDAKKPWVSKFPNFHAMFQSSSCQEGTYKYRLWRKYARTESTVVSWLWRHQSHHRQRLSVCVPPNMPPPTMRAWTEFQDRNAARDFFRPETKRSRRENKVARVSPSELSHAMTDWHDHRDSSVSSSHLWLTHRRIVKPLSRSLSATAVEKAPRQISMASLDQHEIGIQTVSGTPKVDNCVNRTVAACLIELVPLTRVAFKGKSSVLSS